MNGELARQIRRCVHELSPAEKAAVCVDRTRSYRLSPAAREVVMQDARLAAVALLVPSPRVISVSSIAFAAVSYIRCPVRAFTREEAALQWLKDFLPG